MKRYLVTGGTGFIGSALVKALVKNGDFVRVFDNDSRGKSNRLSELTKNVEIREGDIRDIQSVTAACESIDSIIHLAYINGTKFFYEKPELVLEIAVKGMTNIIDAGIAQNVPELFLASSSEVYQTPPETPTKENVPLSIPDAYNPRYSYGGGKIISELMTIHNGKKYFKRAIIFRPHNVYGPDMGEEHVIPELLHKIKKQKNSDRVSLPIQGTGDETRAFIYIDDFVRGLQLLLEKGLHLETYNIGTSDEVSINELVQIMAKVLQKEITTIPEMLRKGSTTRRCPDITKLKALGFHQQVSLEEGIKKAMEWYLS